MKRIIRNRYISAGMLSFFLSFIITLLTGTPLFSQGEGVKASRQSSIEAFSKGDYEKAYSSFCELLTTYSKDPLYKYYAGVCLIRLNRNPEEAATLLNEARLGGSVARIVPSDAIYWQGRALQMTGKYAEAIECFNTFTQVSGKKAARALGVPDCLEQCNNKEGKLMNSAPPHAEDVNESKLVPVNPAGKTIQILNREEDSVKNVPSEKSLPAGYDKILSEAMFLHVKADSLYRIADSLKKNIDKLSYKGKTELRSKIADTENLAASFEKQADNKYTEAQASMNATLFVPVIPDVHKVTVERESIPAENKVSVPVKPVPEQPRIVKRDSVIVVKNAERPVFFVFGISDKPDNSNEKVKVDPVVPPGLIYRVQLAVFRNPVMPSYFKGITPVYGFRVTGTDKTNYSAGMFRRLADATRALAVVRQKGFKDAFIVSLSDGKAVSAERATILEKEWGKKPFTIAVQTRVEVPADTLPPTLSFRVEVMRSVKPVKDDILEGMKKLAGSRGLDCQTLPDGTIVYLAGKFITYESAEEYAGLLSRNGYRDAKVSAWLGKKEIPVDTARQLFENLE